MNISDIVNKVNRLFTKEEKGAIVFMAGASLTMIGAKSDTSDLDLYFTDKVIYNAFIKRHSAIVKPNPKLDDAFILEKEDVEFSYKKETDFKFPIKIETIGGLKVWSLETNRQFYLFLNREKDKIS